ncbi:solute carrier family 13 member 2-like [Diadema setosum]|uniref:solute carrier family 13 member 2-like n=1 Tax=Diadema setosum TaxID=31175 RepID=UPI003B3A9803
MAIESRRICREVCKNWRYLVCVTVPIVFCPIAIIFNNQTGYMAYSISVMAIYWMTECIPLAATACLPFVLFPLFGIMKGSIVCTKYLSDTNALFVGSLIAAIAVERWNLHKRISLRLLLLVGTKPRWLVLGFMATTAFLSMWLCNAATTSMMIPIAQGVLEQIREAAGSADDPNHDHEKTEEQKTNEKANNEIPLTSIHHRRDNSGCEIELDDPAVVVHRDERPSNDPGYETGSENPPAINGTQTSPDPDAADGRPRAFSNRGYEAAPGDQTDVIEGVPNRSETGAERGEPKSDNDHLSRAVILCIPFAANIGGTATLIGTSANLVLSSQVESLYGSQAGLNFGTWLAYALPGVLVSLLLCWVWIEVIYLDCFGLKTRKVTNTDNAREDRIRAAIKTSSAALGPMSFAELVIVCHFVVLILLWLTRDPKFVTGWSVAFGSSYVTDATCAVLVALLFFMWPSRAPYFCTKKRRHDPSKVPEKIPRILTWSVVQKKMAWHVLLLIGAGSALAEACQESGLSAWLGDQFAVFGDLSPGAVALIISIIVAIFTEVTSNAAAATVFLPIIAEMSTGLHVNPLYLMLPAATACSFAFILPAATPPNAIAFASGQLPALDMAKTGLVMTIAGIILSNISLHTLGVWIFDVKSFPDWASNNTAQAL